ATLSRAARLAPLGRWRHSAGGSPAFTAVPPPPLVGRPPPFSSLRRSRGARSHLPIRSGGRGRPIDARRALSAAPNSSFALWAFRSHNTRLSVTSRGNGRPGNGVGGWCGDGRKIGQ